MKKNFGSFFTKRGDPYQKKVENFFSSRYVNSYQSIALVEFIRNMLLLNFFEVISGQKILKNHVKIRLLKRRFEISCFGPKITKKWSFLIILRIISLISIFKMSYLQSYSTMENPKKITASRSDITPFVNKSSKVYP